MKIYALANELNLDRSNTGTITIPFGTWDYGEKKVESQGGGGERTLFFRQTLNSAGAKTIADQIAASVAKGEKGVPVYWGHPDVPELAHKYPDKRAKGWIKSATVESDGLHLSVEWLEENATEGRERVRAYRYSETAVIDTVAHASLYSCRGDRGWSGSVRTMSPFSSIGAM